MAGGCSRSVADGTGRGRFRIDADRPIVDVYLARERARRGGRADAVPVMRAAVDHLFREGQLLAWCVPATGVLVDTLLDHRSESDVAEAEAAQAGSRSSASRLSLTGQWSPTPDAGVVPGGTCRIAGALCPGVGSSACSHPGRGSSAPASVRPSATSAGFLAAAAPELHPLDLGERPAQRGPLGLVVVVTGLQTGHGCTAGWFLSAPRRAWWAQASPQDGSLARAADSRCTTARRPVPAAAGGCVVRLRRINHRSSLPLLGFA